MQLATHTNTHTAAAGVKQGEYNDADVVIVIAVADVAQSVIKELRRSSNSSSNRTLQYAVTFMANGNTLLAATTTETRTTAAATLAPLTAALLSFISFHFDFDLFYFSTRCEK